jgi:hypothetical protein
MLLYHDRPAIEALLLLDRLLYIHESLPSTSSSQPLLQGSLLPLPPFCLTQQRKSLNLPSLSPANSHPHLARLPETLSAHAIAEAAF